LVKSGFSLCLSFLVIKVVVLTLKSCYKDQNVKLSEKQLTHGGSSINVSCQFGFVQSMLTLKKMKKHAVQQQRLWGSPEGPLAKLWRTCLSVCCLIHQAYREIGKYTHGRKADDSLLAQTHVNLSLMATE
jgi:hypothetical protein